MSKEEEMTASLAALGKALNDWGAVLTRVLLVVGVSISLTLSWDSFKNGIEKNRDMNIAQEDHFKAIDARYAILQDKYYDLDGGIKMLNVKLDTIKEDVSHIKQALTAPRH